jgi:cell shape-determining protein MreC
MPGGVAGVVKPEIGGKDLIFDFVRKNTNVRRGQVVVTSGFKSGALESLFPRGIPIGKIGSVKQDELENFQRVRVRPYAELRDIDFVQVITDKGTSGLTAGVSQP